MVRSNPSWKQVRVRVVCHYDDGIIYRTMSDKKLGIKWVGAQIHPDIGKA